MKGDFSRWQIEEEQNFNGVLHQQGRVHLDSDLNDQARIDVAWKDGAGRDVIGPDVAAVPAYTPNAFKVTEASAPGDDVILQVTPGKVWADGKAAHLLGEEPDLTADVTRQATYLQPPIQAPPGEITDIEAGVRDAVILELWREELNGFQVPEALIEPALGGPDTTERMQTAMRFRLFRMGEDDTCRNIIDRLRDDFSQKLKLKVSLLPTSSSDGDCPVMEGGGYVGFEHHFYRIEMAQVDSAETMFKWSQFNGGLVGRGRFETTGPDKKMVIHANDQAIKTCGLNSFYMEVIDYDEDQGYWRLKYGAEVTLNGNELVVGDEHYMEATPGSDEFFRLWNNIEKITDYPIPSGSDEPEELHDGIRLEFDTSTGAYYQPGDFWTFKVRAGGIDYHDPDDPLIDNLPPEGVHYIRVPLAILNWNDERSITFEAEEIDDCRTIFRPLTRQKVCCSYVIGDGVTTFGDFNSLEEGLRHLPSEGGELCLLPGLHFASLLIEGKENIKIHGCDRRTRVTPPESDTAAPIFHVKDSSVITLEHMDLVTYAGTAIIIEGSEWGSASGIEVHNNRIIAWTNAIHADQVAGLSVHHNQIRMWDVEDGDVAVFFRGEGALIERNRIFVEPYEPGSESGDNGNGHGHTDPEANCCIDREPPYGTMNVHFDKFDKFAGDLRIEQTFKARSGIQIGNGSERVRILENIIYGGAGNGITLGSDLDPQDFVGVIDEQTDVDPLVLEDEMNTLRGHVEEDGSRIDEIVDVLFTDVETNLVMSATTDSTGGYSISDLPPGTYNISISEEEYRVVGHGYGDNNAYVIEVERVEPSFDLTEVFAFIYQVSIEANEISGTGLSGIGLPLATLEDLFALAGSVDPATVNVGLAIVVILMVLLFGFVGGFVVDLRVEDNRIRQCARQIPSGENIPFLRLEGGVSLGFCEDVRLRGNRIENNGVEQNGRVFGICAILAEQLELSGNHVLDNGPSLNDDGDTSATGVLGGVLVLFSTAFSLGTKLLSSLETATKGEYAARIFDNVIDQPVGRALTMLAFGPLSVNNNYFNSITSTGNPLDLLVGSVFIANFGGMDRMTDLEARAARSAEATENDEEEPMGSAPPPEASGNSDDLNVDMELPPGALLSHRPSNRALAQKRQTLLPDGNTLYAENQIHLGAGSRSALAQLIVTADDLGYANNQCMAMNSLEGMETLSIILGAGDLEFASLINTVLFGRTLRATDSRFKESYVEEFGLMAASLLSISFFHNNTTSNQGDHCIIAVAWKESDFSTEDHVRVSRLNQVLLNPIRDCMGYEEWIAGLNDEQRVQFMVLIIMGLLMGRV